MPKHKKSLRKVCGRNARRGRNVRCGQEARRDQNSERPAKLTAALLIAVFALSGALLGMLANNIGNELQTSTIRETYLAKKKHGKVLHKLLSQLAEKSSRPSAPDRENTRTSCFYVKPEIQAYKAEFVKGAAQNWQAAGEEFEVSIYVKNTGNVPWFGDNSSCGEDGFVRLGTAKERDRTSIVYDARDKRWGGGNRIKMVEARINPGEIATFSFTGQAPWYRDIYREYFQPVVEGKQWIENEGATGIVDFYIGPNEWETVMDYEERLKYANRSIQASTIDISGERIVDVDLSEQKMVVKFGGTVIREYMVSTGTFNRPTPTGIYPILNKQELRISNAYPHYHMPYWQGFTKMGHGLHALPYLANDGGVFWKEALTHIGQRVSHGCIRLLTDDAKDLYGLTEVGTTKVVIHY